MGGPNDDYYSYRPRVKLDRAVALAGFPGCRPLQTARVAAMITGLETVMLPHQVAHALDQHPESMLLSGAQDALGDAELALLRRTESKRRPPIIALGPTTLEDPGCRAWIRANALLVHLRQPLPDAVARIREEAEQDPRKHKHLTVHGGYDETSLAPIYSLRTGLLQREAEIEIDISGRSPLEVGRSLPEALGWVVA